jgi:hypothetical protein
VSSAAAPTDRRPRRQDTLGTAAETRCVRCDRSQRRVGIRIAADLAALYSSSPGVVEERAEKGLDSRVRGDAGQGPMRPVHNVEVGFDVLIASWLKVFLNYSWQKLKGDVFPEVASVLSLSVPGRSLAQRLPLLEGQLGGRYRVRLDWLLRPLCIPVHSHVWRAWASCRCAWGLSFPGRILRFPGKEGLTDC